jgi:hypothetical protein
LKGLNIDGIGLLQQGYIFWGNVAQASNGQSGTRKRVSVDKGSWYSKGIAYSSNFVFKQRTKGFNQSHFHGSGQAPYIVVAFYGNRGTCNRYRFNHIGINSALGQPMYGMRYGFGFRFKNPNKKFTNDFSFGFWIGFAR